VANRPIYVALAVTVEGTRDILGLWVGEHGDGEGAKYWMRVLTEIKNRGTQDCLIMVCDGLKGLPEAIAAVWPGDYRANLRGALCRPLDYADIESIGAGERGCGAAFYRHNRGGITRGIVCRIVIAGMRR
jgi:Transposase, Mutator family